MSSTAIGDALEESIYILLQTEIEADRFWAKKESCRLFRKKGYFSKDRNSEIIFDVSIEMYLPGATDYSALVLIECKNYSHAVPVDDAEEFFAKVQQVGAANSKAIIASTATFQSGTKAFAKSKCIGLLRYFDPRSFKWELHRSPSASAGSANAEAAAIISDGLSNSNFHSQTFDLYMQSPVRNTNSLWEFIEDLVDITQVRRIANPRSRLASSVPYLEKNDLEARAEEILLGIGYISGEVNLDSVCAKEMQSCGLKILTDMPPPSTGGATPILGRILFNLRQIEIYTHPVPNKGRERFTLAHELAHHLLHHEKYMLRDSCDETDFSLGGQRVDESIDIVRMEFQANYFAASLLMPRKNFITVFHLILGRMGIKNKGFSPLFVDNQPCNLQNYETTISKLTEIYGVSRTAAMIRLEALGLLRDVRKQTRLQPLLSAIAAEFRERPQDEGPPLDPR
ncbi:MAG: ImmA/IrrE family metallo-endopeptidase [Gallionellaceae bacterium]|jgi:Zn-dependent peptidase ImmA (M78 family)